MITMKFFIFFIFLLTQHCQSTWTNQVLLIESGICLGNCPVYSLKMESNGRFVLTHLNNKTTKQGKLSRKDKDELDEILSLIDFSNAKKQYGNPLIRDFPKISISYGNVLINLTGRQSAPEPIQKLIKWADDFHNKKLKSF